MVRLTLDMLANCKTQQLRMKDEPLSKYVKRLTHFGLSDHHITELTEDVYECKNATAFYLSENALTRVAFLDRCHLLTQLYLQNNDLVSMAGLETLHSLERLYLGHNAIAVLEGIHQLPALRELHMEFQRLPAGHQLEMDPRVGEGLSQTLRVLNLAGNSIRELGGIAGLAGLIRLDLSDNSIAMFEELVPVLRNNERLKRLAIAGNPVSSSSRLREHVVRLCPELQSLDAAPVTAIQRRFLLNWDQARREAGRPARKMVGGRTLAPIPAAPLRLGDSATAATVLAPTRPPNPVSLRHGGSTGVRRTTVPGRPSVPAPKKSLGGGSVLPPLALSGKEVRQLRAGAVTSL